MKVINLIYISHSCDFKNILIKILMGFLKQGIYGNKITSQEQPEKFNYLF